MAKKMGTSVLFRGECQTAFLCVAGLWMDRPEWGGTQNGMDGQAKVGTS